MKTFLVDYKTEATGNEISWYFLADSAISNAGKPFFKPEGIIEVAFTPAFKIKRLGKNIARRYWERYISDFAPAFHFRLSDMYSRLQKKGLSTDPAISFDKSLFLADFKNIEDYLDNERKIYFFKNNELKDSFDLRNILSELPYQIEQLSKLNTLKIGDIVLPFHSKRIQIEINDILSINYGESNLLLTKIK